MNFFLRILRNYFSNFFFFFFFFCESAFMKLGLLRCKKSSELPYYGKNFSIEKYTQKENCYFI